MDTLSVKMLLFNANKEPFVKVIIDTVAATLTPAPETANSLNNKTAATAMAMT